MTSPMRRPTVGVAVLPRTDITSKLLVSFLFAGLTAICAVISLRLWFTPVPITLQVLPVILAGLVLGSRWGAISQIQYIMMGVMGLPVFANGIAGPIVFAGPTGGYLIGFVVGAFAAGWVFERLKDHTRLAAGIGGIAGIAGIHLLGASWLGLWIGLMSKSPLESCIRSAWQLGIVPFFMFDLLKAAAASIMVTGGRWGHKRLQG